MTDLRAAAQQALESPGCERLKDWASVGPVQRAAVESFLQAALAQEEQDTDCHAQGICQRSGYGIGARPEQEPVAYLYHDAQSAHDAHPLVHSTLLVMAIDRRPECRNETPLYTHPPRREWRSLSEEEIEVLNELRLTRQQFARAIEQALKERNT
jgi:hypothetical protein